MNLSDPFYQFQLTSSICSSVAIASTIYRLYVRRSKFWVDDGCAFCSMLALCVQIIATFTPLSLSTGVARYYLMITAFYIIVWTSRFSILFSVIRIDPSKFRKRALLSGAFMFFVVCAFLIAQLYWTCEPQHAWKKWRVPQCTLSKQVAITQLVFDTVADLVVLIVPLQLLVVLQDKWLRSRLMMIFSTCMITTVVSLVHAIAILTLKGPAIVIVALVESSISLIVCNLPVIATALLNLGDHSPPRLQPSGNSSNSADEHPQMSVRFLTHTPSQTSASVLLTEPPLALRHERSLGFSTRPSSVMLKPDMDHPPRI